MKSIRSRLSIALVSALALLCSLGGGAVYWRMRSTLRAKLDADLDAKAWALMATVREDLDHDADEGSPLLAEFERDELPSYFQLLLPDGRMQVSSPGFAEGLIVPPEGLGLQPKHWDQRLPSGRAGRAVGVRAEIEGEEYEEHHDEDHPGEFATLIVARDLGRIESLLASLRWSLVGAGLAFVLIATGIVRWALRTGLAPLDALARRAQAIEPHSLSTRFDTSGAPAELAPIVERLNDLLARLDGAFQRERRFNAAVAHELRTPIAELRTLSEVALCPPVDSAASSQALGEVRDVAVGMERLVTTLLALRRSEEGKLELVHDVVSPAEVWDESLEPLRAAASGKGLRIEAAIPAEFRVECDRTLLSSIASNLASNAVEYAPRGSVVASSVSADADRFSWTFANDAAELSQDDLRRLFEPFWRKDSARTGSAHAGLGLALARGFAEAMGWSLDARLDAGRLFVTLACTNGAHEAPS